MISFLLIYINPIKQIQKARDAQKEQNLKQINNALDQYYNDNNRYPTTFTFGGTWQAGNNVYMQKIPQDPDCYVGGPCYSYLTNPLNPQWNILFAKVNNAPNSSVSCALTSLNNCLPSNYATSGYNYCVLSGKVDCNFVASQSLPPANAGAGTGGNGGGGAAPPPPLPPLPPPPPGVSCSTYYALTGTDQFGNPTCNNLGADPDNQCSIHTPGTYTCYSVSNCTAPLCR